MILAIDPDSDRIGALCFNNKNGLYYHMNGNEVAAIIFYFLCEFENTMLQSFLAVFVEILKELFKKNTILMDSLTLPEEVLLTSDV
mgnify:CR=1 FL=1